MNTPARQTHDEWIALRCRLGEPGAFAELVREMERPLLYYAAKLLASDEAALDVLQEVWLTAFRAIRRLEDPRTVRSWLYRITHDRAIDHIRHDRSRDRAEKARAVTLPVDREPEPAFDAEDAEALHRAVDRIDLKHREVIVLHFLEDLSIAEIAAVIGEPPGTVKSRIHYAKRALREALQNHEQSR